ncbi:MAG: beta-propeller fold lactonase family protein [Caldilineaceae bacterium]
MSRKLSYLLTLLLLIVSVAPAFAQEPDAANRSIFLPLISGSGQATSSTDTDSVEENLTEEGAAVEAAHADNMGLVFVSTNANDLVRGNEVVMYRRASNGTLTVTGRFPTGGQGLGAGLGSQGTVVLSDNGRWLFVVNAGSNEISVFAVQNAALILTDKVASGGMRPTSLTVRKNLLYVLNAGDPGNITGFKLNKDGKLAALANSTRWLSNNGSGVAPAPAQVSFSPDGENLVVSERATNLLDLYNVDKNGLVKSSTVVNSAGITPFGFAFAKGNTLVVSEAFGGATNASASSSYRLDDGQLKLVSASVPTGQTAACWIVIAGNGKFAYTTNAGSASLSLYAVGHKGELTLLNGRAGDTGAGTGPTDAAVSQNGRWLYALSPRSQNVVGFGVQENGSLNNLGSFGGLPTTAAGIAAW